MRGRGANEEVSHNEAASEQPDVQAALNKGWEKIMERTEDGDGFNKKTVEWIVSSLETNKPMSPSELVSYIETMVGYKIRNYQLGIAIHYLENIAGAIHKSEDGKYELTSDYWIDKDAQPSPEDDDPDDDGEGGRFKWDNRYLSMKQPIGSQKCLRK